MRALLGHRDFLRLSLGSSLHSASFQGEQVLVGLMVYRLTESTLWVGISLALSFAPMLFVGVPAGATADRFDRRKLLAGFEVVLLFIMGTVTFFAWTASIELVGLMCLVTATGTMRALHHPARLSYAQDLLGHTKLVPALGMMNVCVRIGQLSGAVLAGSLMERLGAGPAFLALACAHALAWLAFQDLEKVGRSKSAKIQSLRDDLAEYAWELRHNPVLLKLTGLASCVEVFGFSFVTALPELATGVLGFEAEGLGFLHAARSVGGLVAGLFLVWNKRHIPLGIVYLGAMIGFGVALLLLTQATNIFLAMLVVAIVALCAATSDVLAQSMMQFSVSDHLRGRAMGAWVLALGVGPLGHLELGAVIAVAGASSGLALNGAVLIVLGVITAAGAPSIRRI